MKQQPDNTWEALKDANHLNSLPEALIQYSFFIDFEQKILYSSPALAHLLVSEEKKPKEIFSFRELSSVLTEASRNRIEQDLSLLAEGNTLRTDTQIDLISKHDSAPALCLMVRLPEQPMIFSLVHLDHELKHEYQDTLNQVITKLRRSQTINQLILEGSTDYIYQLDLVNNVCTFSPKAMDVLPLESPTFDNAMDRVLSFIIPEDRHIFLESFTPFLSGQSLYHTAEYRVNTKQGTIMWISCHGKGVLDEKGNPVMIAGSLMDITEMKKSEAQMKKMLYTDTLTGLKNRYCYEKEMEEHLKKPGASGCILCVDIHNFKLYNEIYGYNFGNRILKEFAKILQIYFPNQVGLYRLDGDEFLLHLEETDRDTILSIITPFQIALTKARIIDSHSIYIDIRIGIAFYPTHGETPDKLLKNADTILYEMSKYSHDTVAFYADESRTDLSRRYRLEHELRTDINSGFRHFRVVYQPITHIGPEGNTWCSAEALLRYNNPDLPDTTQQQLIETLEVSDLIIPVGRWVLVQAIRECSLWNQGESHFSVHVNFSAQQMSDAGIFEHIVATLRENHLSAENLICELTETSLINNFESATRLCRDLMKMGVGIALDDFGTGYTSFNYLRDFPINQIKIDKTYVQDIIHNEYNRIIIRCLYDLSKSMGLELCIEGVEDKETLDILTDMGANMIQGFYFGRPMEPEMIRKGFIALR